MGPHREREKVSDLGRVQTHNLQFQNNQAVSVMILCPGPILHCIGRHEFCLLENWPGCVVDKLDLLGSGAVAGLEVWVDSALSVPTPDGIVDADLGGLVSFTGVFFFVSEPPNKSVSRSSIPWEYQMMDIHTIQHIIQDL